MKTLLAVSLVSVVSGLSPTGCANLFYAYFGPAPKDPKAGLQHGPPAPGRAAGVEGRPFKGRAQGELASRMTLTHGEVNTKSNKARFIGTFKSTLTGAPQSGDEALGPLAAAQWHGSFRVVRSRVTGKTKVKGLVLATFDDPSAGRACLRLKSKGHRKQNRRPTKPGRNALTMIGGEGGARTLRGTASVRARFKKSGVVRLRGRVNARRGAERGLPKPCRKLRDKFGLQPL
jgi:hypothetical protein